MVENFLFTQKSNSLGVDVGCGNGKYLVVNPKLYIVGCDACAELLQAASMKTKTDLIVANNLSLPYRDETFDFCISIAVIHHLSTPERRLSAIQEMFRVLKRGSKMLIFVWAFEQKGRRKFEDQDSMVSWELKEKFSKDQQKRTYHRYYHLFKEGELESLIINNFKDAAITEKGYDCDNWWVIVQKN